MVITHKILLKLLRDMRAAKFQFGAVVLVILLGVAMYIGAYSAYVNLNNSYEDSFDMLGMADYWISVDYISDRAVKELDKVPGVTAQGRIIGTVQIDLEKGEGERIEGRVISLPHQENNIVNRILINQGEYFSDSAGREILLEKHFADYHDLNSGDYLTLDVNGNKAAYRIVGVVTSPEYIFVTKSEQDIMPLPRTFGVLFVSHATAEKLFNLDGLVTEINLLVDDSVRHEEISQQIREILPRFDIKRITFKDDPVSIETRKIDIVRGVRSAYVIERADQIANKLLKQDLESFQQLSYLFPFLFLSIASFTIYVLLSRLVDSQRVQIGLMRGLGYTRLAILLHYVGFALIVGILGSLLGAVLGNLIARGITGMYVAQLNIPFTVVHIRWDITLTGMLIGIIIPVLAGLIPAWSTMKLKPAIAMRPALPAAGHKVFIEKILPFLSKLPYIFKITMRNLFRKFRQSLFMALGVAFAVMLVLVSMSFLDTFNHALNIQFNQIQKYDAIIHFQDSGAASTANYIKHFAGIKEAEAVIQVPYRLKFGDNSADTGIMGLPPGSSMYNLKSAGGETLHITDDGILLPQWLEKRLGARVGDTIQMEPLLGTLGKTEKKLTGYVDFFMGGRAFMSLHEVQKMTRSSGTATGIMIIFQGRPSEELIRRLYDIQGAATIEFVEDTRIFFDQQMAFMWVFIAFMLIMGASLGIAIIFNGVMVNVLQRTRELALMRVVGMSHGWIAAILTMENFLIGIVGVLLGIPMGRWVADYFMNTVGSMSEEAMTMNLAIFPHSYALAIALALTMLMVSQIPAIRQVRKMSLTTALKDWYE